jgi:acetylornithine deacetylase/succinyl-diaminopimelate desuccinylase-like protein
MPHLVLQYAHQHKSKFLNELQSILAIPSISTLPEHKPDIDKMAKWLRIHLLKIGLDNASIYHTAGHPIVYGEWLHAKNQPTLLIYGHYDIQPPDPLEQWHTPPFQPTIKDNFIYARGASDDKSQFFTHLKAIQSYLHTHKKLPINIKVLIEGEEEQGSETLEKFVNQGKKLLKADAALISDTHMADPEQPLLITGLRGLLYFQINLQTAKFDLHSGSYGGGVANSAIELINLLCQLKDRQNRITIPGFYDQVQHLPIRELKNLYTNKDKFRTSSQAYHYRHEPHIPIHLMPKIRPSMDINGIISGFTGNGSKTIIPHQASAKISFRLVPNQNPQIITKAFEKHLYSLTPKNIRLSITRHGQAAPVSIPTNSPYIKAAIQTLKTTFTKTPKFTREGGTIPVVEILQRLLKINSVLMGYGLPDDNLHAPNERFYLPNFYKGIENNIKFYQQLSESIP